MLKGAIGSALLAAGYLIVYAAVAGGGTYALRPWDALAPSAPWPTGSSGGASSSASAGGSSSSPSKSSGGGGLGGWLKGTLGIAGDIGGKVFGL